jgi:hypothetical protein
MTKDLVTEKISYIPGEAGSLYPNEITCEMKQNLNDTLERNISRKSSQVEETVGRFSDETDQFQIRETIYPCKSLRCATYDEESPIETFNADELPISNA